MPIASPARGENQPAEAAEPVALRAGPDEAGTRLDRFLAARIPGLTRSRAKALVEAGHLERDGTGTPLPAEPVRSGTTYRLSLPAPVPAEPRPQAMALPILHEDDALIVLDKPAGLVVHPAPGNEDGTLVNALLAHCGATLPGIGGERRPGIVHRLDKDTSGVMVVAKTEAALAGLSADFAARRLERSYLAVAWGLPAPADGRWQGAIGRDPRDRKRMAVVSRGGREAATRYRTIDVVAAAVSLLRLSLETGRTHQIRVHAAAARHPLLGDPVYLRRIPSEARLLAPEARGAALDFPRQALHAEMLGFTHPTTGRAMRFSQPPPSDLAALIASLGLRAPTRV